MAKTETSPEFKTVRIHSDTYDALHTLLATVSQNGWSIVGAKRSDPPTLTALLDEGIAALIRATSSRARA